MAIKLLHPNFEIHRSMLLIKILRKHYLHKTVHGSASKYRIVRIALKNGIPIIVLKRKWFKECDISHSRFRNELVMYFGINLVKSVKYVGSSFNDE
jgi:hypothetical protein